MDDTGEIRPGEVTGLLAGLYVHHHGDSYRRFTERGNHHDNIRSEICNPSHDHDSITWSLEHNFRHHSHTALHTSNSTHLSTFIPIIIYPTFPTLCTMSRIPDLLGTGDLLPVPEYSFTEDQSRELKHLLQCHESAITTIDFCMDELCGALERAKVQLNLIEEQREDLDNLEDSIEHLRFRPENKTSTFWAGTLQDKFFPRMFGVSPSDERYDWDAPSASVPIPGELVTHTGCVWCIESVHG